MQGAQSWDEAALTLISPARGSLYVTVAPDFDPRSRIPGFRHSPDWGEKRLRPLIKKKKVCAKTEAAYYLGARPESVFI